MSQTETRVFLDLLQELKLFLEGELIYAKSHF